MRPIYYDLRDLAEDINAGFINIPSEDIKSYGMFNSGYVELLEQSKKFGVEMEKLRDQYTTIPKSTFKKQLESLRTAYYQGLPSNVKQWVANEVRKGNANLESHYKHKPHMDLALMTKLVLNVGYEKSAGNYFNWLSQPWFTQKLP